MNMTEYALKGLEYEKLIERMYEAVRKDIKNVDKSNITDDFISLIFEVGEKLRIVNINYRNYKYRISYLQREFEDNELLKSIKEEDRPTKRQLNELYSKDTWISKFVRNVACNPYKARFKHRDIIKRLNGLGRKAINNKIPIHDWLIELHKEGLLHFQDGYDESLYN